MDDNCECVKETLEVLSDSDEMREIEEGVKAYRAGEGKTFEQFRKELGV